MAIPANQAQNLAEYAAVREGGAGLLDLSSRGRILVNGSEAVTFLNGLITNDMKALDKSHWMPAAFPNVQGRLIAAIRVIHNDEGFLIDTESVTHDSVLKLVERFTLAGDFRVVDLTEEMSLLSIQGANAAEVAAAVLGETLANLGRSAVATLDWQGEHLTVIRASHTGEDGFDVFVPKSNAAALTTAIVSAGAQPVGIDAFETLRIEAGIPRYGIDMDETNVVTETNLDEAVSFAKGCYIGQEIIARIKYRGHVAKKFTGLIFDGGVALKSGAKILSTEDKEIGRITSSAFSPRLNRTIALGYVKYDYLKPGTSVKVDDAGHEQQTARVIELPFVSGSRRPTSNG
jgi:folate-binding protein YgfZ